MSPIARYSPRWQARGLSLIELLIGLVLGLLVLAGLLTVFSSSRTAYEVGSANARMQENMRFALEILKPELRSAAHAGFCAGNVPITNHLNQNCPGAVVELFDAAEAIHGWEFTGTGPGQAYTVTAFNPVGVAPTQWRSYRRELANTVPLPEALRNRVVPGTDVLVVRTRSTVPNVTGCSSNVVKSKAINTCDANDKSVTSGIEQDEIVLVTNCSTNADLFQTTSSATSTNLAAGKSACTNPGPGNANDTIWSQAYQDDMQIQRIAVVAYYIGFNAQRNQPGLYRMYIGGRNPNQASNAPEELVEGIENMQLLWGVSMAESDSRNDGRSIDAWLPADQVPRWDRVLAVRVSLLSRSPDPADPIAVARDFDLGPTITTQADRRLRQAAHATIAIRNRVLVP